MALWISLGDANKVVASTCCICIHLLHLHLLAAFAVASRMYAIMSEVLSYERRDTAISAKPSMIYTDLGFCHPWGSLNKVLLLLAVKLQLSID